MKSIIYFLHAIYTGMALLSIFSYLLDLILNKELALGHPEFLLNYLVYFTIYKTWLIGLVFPPYLALFYKCKGWELIFYRVLYVLVCAACLTLVYQKADLSLAHNDRGVKSFLMYALTGVTLIVIQRAYWSRSGYSSKIWGTDEDAVK